jgi:hypothetical protein
MRGLRFYRLFFSLFCLLLLKSPVGTAQAHFQPGVASIRDYSVPGEEGLYFVDYNFGYLTSQLNDDNGNKVSSVILGPPGGPNVPLNVDVDVKIYANAPTFLWATKWKIFGARYAAYVSPTFSNSSIGASLSRINGNGFNPETGQFAVGDLFVQPFWLGWNRKHVDVAAGYGFYAPVGKYNYQTITLPVIGDRTITNADNIGLGFWTHQVQGNVTWYPNVNRFTAATNTITAEFNGNQRGTNSTLGDFVTWNWGISQYALLGKQPRFLLEAGPTGYGQWQITDTTGANVTNGNLHDQVYAAGAQVGVTYLPKNLQFNFRYLGEFYARNRFRGSSLSLNIAYVLHKPKPPAAPKTP